VAFRKPATMSTTKPKRRDVRRSATLIDPTCLYTRRHFLEVTGLTRHNLYAAADLGVQLKTIDLGSRLYVEGADGIAFIKEYAVAKKAAETGVGGR
jgi:hypothetical protein